MDELGLEGCCCSHDRADYGLDSFDVSPWGLADDFEAAWEPEEIDPFGNVNYYQDTVPTLGFHAGRLAADGLPQEGGLGALVRRMIQLARVL